MRSRKSSRAVSGCCRSTRAARVARYCGIVRRQPATHAGLLALMGAALRHDARSRLEGIRTRTLVLAGAWDRLLAPAAQRGLASLIPGARFGVIARAGHDV